MARRRERRRTGVRTHATKEESTGIQNGSTINVYINETSPDNMTDNLHNPSLPEGRKPISTKAKCGTRVRTHATEEESTGILLASTINVYINETSPDNMTDNLHNPSLPEGRKPISVFLGKGLVMKKTFINEKSKAINARKGGKSTSAESQVDETTLYIAAESGAKKRNMYGVGSKRFDYLKDSGNETPAISKAYDGWEKKSLKMERKINKSNKTLEIVCSRFNITLLDCDSYSENGVEEMLIKVLTLVTPEQL
ncbi:hypothetical protein Tco_1106046 [Tanacetum coccineum]